MNESAWQMRVEGTLSAHFFQPDGSSRPGTDWKVALTSGDAVHQVIVRAYLGKDTSRKTRADTEYQGRTVMGYLGDLLDQGWTPGQQRELTVEIQNPIAGSSESSTKPWWRVW